MFHGDGGLDGIFSIPPQIDADTSQAGEFVKKQIATAKASLILDQPFFGYLLGHFEIVPVDKVILHFAADTNHIYVNTSYFTEINQAPSWKGKTKGILIHLLIHIIFRHHKRQRNYDPKLWGLATDIVVISYLSRITEGWIMPSDWVLPSIDTIPEEYQTKTADEVYQALLEEITESEAGRRADNTEEELDTHPNLEDLIMNQVAVKQEEMGLREENCDIDEVVLEVNTESDQEELEEQYFEGLLRTAYERQKGFGSLPEGLDRFLSERLTPSVDWKTTLSRYLQKIITHDLSWSRPNRRLLGQGYHLPGPLKENTSVVLGVDTSGSIEEEQLSRFLSEIQSILESVTNVKLTLIDCDAEIHQIREYETGEPLKVHTFRGGGGTDFRPVFEKLPELEVDALIYITDGRGIFPQTSPDIPVIWALTEDTQVPFGNIVYLR
ncbi:MAG: vWA domain-containing protein [Candidatus Kariarchaeaceae archaeon]